MSILQEVDVCVGVARRRHRLGRVCDRTFDPKHINNSLIFSYNLT
ncbi:MAG: hypothetical protein V7K27_05960 [Nostoc sp.]